MRHSLYIILFVALSIAGQAQAAPVSPREALAIAGRYLSNRSLHKAPALKHLSLAWTARDGKGNNYYYAFNNSSGGYILVSGDDRAVPVLGYCREGSFNQKLLPANLREWLRGYERQLDWLLAHPEASMTAMPSFDSHVDPLLGDTEWDQLEPYNNLCPEYEDYYTGERGRSATGCVATAMGQVMRRYSWPSGYDWADMLPRYDKGSYTEKQAAAVATLLHDVGVAVNMDYGYSSGAYSTDIAPALRGKFGYGARMVYRNREFYTTAEWLTLLRQELDGGRPVVYGGCTDQDEGHSFVCDGYNEDGFFHINWGWSGTDNGYYAITALDPATMGRGGAASGHGFNYYQDIVTGIAPPVEGETALVEICTDGFDFETQTLSKDDEATTELTTLYNYGSENVTIRPVFVVFDSKGKELKRFASEEQTVIAGDKVRYVAFTLSAGGLADGDYVARPFYTLGQSDSLRAIRFIQGDNNRLHIVVNGDKASYEPAGGAALSWTAITTEPAPLKADTVNTLRVTLHNRGSAYEGTVYCYLSQPDDYFGDTFTSRKQQITLPQDADTTLTFKEKLKIDVGTYVLRLYDRHENQIGTDTTLTVVPGPEPASLSVKDGTAFEGGNEQVPYNKMRLQVGISNSGGPFSGQLTARIYGEGGSGSVIGTMDSLVLSIPSGAEVTATFTGDVTSLVENGKMKVGGSYQIVLYDDEADDWMQPMYNACVDFTLGKAVATGIGAVETRKAVRVRYYNMQGQPVDRDYRGIVIRKDSTGRVVKTIRR